MNSRELQFVEAFKDKSESYLSRIDNELRMELNKYSNSPLYEPMKYVIEDGKRVRPLILLLSTESIGISEENPLPSAVAVELLHTESIIHDDIIDQDATRRGRASFHARYGYNKSVLTADFVFGMILNIASRYRNPRIARELSIAALKMCEGEFKEMKINSESKKISLDEYIYVVSHKTASLFETSAKIGGILGGGGEGEVSALAEYGLELGIAYQIQDDIIDWNDINKLTKNIEIEPDEIQERLKEMSKIHAENAKKKLDILGDGAAKEFLRELSDFSIHRQY